MIKKCLVVIFAIFLLFSLASKVGAIEYAPLIGPGMMNIAGDKIYLPPVKLYPAGLTPGVETIVYAFLGSEGIQADPPIFIDYGQDGGCGENTVKLYWRYRNYILDQKKYDEDGWGTLGNLNDWDDVSPTSMLPMYDPTLGPPNINPALDFVVPPAPVANLDYAQKIRIFVGRIPSSLLPYAKIEYRIEAKDTAGALVVEGRTRPSNSIGSSKVASDPYDPDPSQVGTNKWNFIVNDGDQDVIDPLCNPPCNPSIGECDARWYQGCHQGDIHHSYPTNACWANLHTGEKVDAAKCTACEDDCDDCIAENPVNCAGLTCESLSTECKEKCEERCACCHTDLGGDDPRASGEEGTATVWVYPCNEFKTTYCSNPDAFGCHRKGGCFEGRITNNWRGKKEGASHVAKLEIPGGLDYKDITVAANENRFYMKAKFRDIPEQDLGTMDTCGALQMFGDLLDNKVLYAYLWLIKVENPDGGVGYIMYLPLLYDIINNAFDMIISNPDPICIAQFIFNYGQDALDLIQGFINTGGGDGQEDPGEGGEPGANEQPSDASNPLMLLSESKVHLFKNLLVLTKLMEPTLTPEQAAEFTPCGNASIDGVDKSLSMAFEMGRNPWKKLIGPNPSGNLLISGQSAAIGIIMTEPYLAALVLGVDITGKLSYQSPVTSEDIFTVGRFYRRKPSSTSVQPDFVAPGKPVVAELAAPAAGGPITITWAHPTLNSDGTPIKDDPGFKIDFDPDNGIGGYNIYRRHAKPGSATWSGWKWLNEDRSGNWEWKWGPGGDIVDFRTPENDNLYFSTDPKQAGANRPYMNKGKANDLLNAITCSSPSYIWYKKTEGTTTTWQRSLLTNCSAISFVDIALANSDDVEDRHLAGYSYQYKIVACDFPNPTNLRNTGANQYMSYYKYYDPLIPANCDADPNNNEPQLNSYPFGGKVDTTPPYNQGPSALSNLVTIAGGIPPPPPQGGGDINEDGDVTLADFSLLAKAYGCSDGDPNWNPKCDLNGDGKVNLTDFGILVKGYNE